EALGRRVEARGMALGQCVGMLLEVGERLEEKAVQLAQLAVSLRPRAGLPQREREREPGPRVPDLTEVHETPVAPLRATHRAITDPERRGRAFTDRIHAIARLVEPPVAWPHTQ